VRNQHGRATAAAAAVLLAAFALAPAPSSGVTLAGEVASSSTAVRDALKFREDFGLSTDPALVSLLSNDTSANMEFGVPLTNAELANLQQRGAIESQLGPIVTALGAFPEFAGLYVDQADGGRVVVTVAGDEAKIAAALSSALPAGARSRIEHVDRNLAALEQIRQSAQNQFDALARSSGLTSLAIDTRTNRVDFGIDPFDSNVAVSLIGQFGPGASVVFNPLATLDSCTSRDNCGSPMKGGLRITTVVDPLTGYECTSGFLAGKTAGGVANHLYLLTAGHCLAHGGGNNHSWSHHAVPFGTSRTYQFCDCCSADVGVIEISVWATPTNEVFAVSSTDIRHITSRVGNGAQVQGAAACRAGEKSNNYKCGFILAADQDIVLFDPESGQNVHYNHTWQMNQPAQRGDSGGPIMYNSAAMGLLVGGSSSTYYSTLDWISSSVGYRPCITANANPCS
jgi:hypothetical protein